MLTKQIYQLLAASTHASTSALQQAEITGSLRKLSHQPAFCPALLKILQCPQNSTSIRGIAGLVLKNEIKLRAEHIQPADLHFLTQNLLAGIGDPDEFIRKTTAAVAVALYERLEGSQGWPSLFNTIVLGLASTADLALVSGAMWLLRLLCEDYTCDWIEEAEGLASAVLSSLFVHAQSEADWRLRNSALGCVNLLIYSKPQALSANLEVFVGILGKFSGCKESTKEICTCLASLVECYSGELQDQMGTIMEFMIVSLASPAYDVAFEACEFWLAAGEMECHYARITALLPSLIPGLLRCLPYGDDDVEVLQESEHMSNYAHSSARAEDRDEDDEGTDGEGSTDQDMEWNLRRCAASTLDLLADVLDSFVMVPLLLPSIQPLLNSSDWRGLEAGILVLGAVAEGCLEAMKPHLPALIPWLASVLEQGSNCNLVKSITCWTLGRYYSWIIENPAILTLVTEALAVQVASSMHPKVQSSATTALVAILGEIPNCTLTPHIQKALLQGLDHFTVHNRILLYNALSTLAERTTSALEDLFIPALLSRWPQTADDLELIPIIECLGYLAPKCGNSVLYAKTFYDRALQIIRIPDADPDLIYTAFDFLDALLRAGFFQFFDGAFTEALMDGLGSRYPSVRQSAFGALGDVALCKNAPFAQSIIQANRNQIDRSLMLNLDPQLGPPVSHAVSNNASWALGVIYISPALTPPITEHTPLFVGVLIALLERSISGKGARISRALLENAAIALARIGAVEPQVVAARVDALVKVDWMRWIVGVVETPEMEHSLWGVLQVVKAERALGAAALTEHVRRWKGKIVPGSENVALILKEFE